jgi:hypothetical protein
MRRRAYLYWLLVVAFISLVPSVLIPDIIAVSLRHRPPVKADTVIAFVYESLTKWPIWVYRTFGASVRMPLSWPPWLSHGVMMLIMLVPFWFLAGVPFLELSFWWRRRAQIHEQAAHA